MLNWLLRLFSALLFITLISLPTGFIMSWIGAYLFISPNLPDTTTLSKTKMQAPLHIYSLDGQLIGRYGSKHRKTISYDNTPETLINAILAAEDDRFFEHPGVDIKSLIRAIYSYYSPEKALSGGSTITMQLAKMYFLSHEKTILRKLNQIFLALHIELHHSKKEIFELYLNKIYLGNHAYGVQTAAKTYYNKPLDKLTLAQTAMIAGIPKAPSSKNPLSDPNAATSRRNWILKRMYDLGYIDYLAYINAADDPITAQKHNDNTRINSAYAYPAEMARQQAYEMFGEELYSGGYTIYTTIDSRLQKAAQAALIKGLHAYDNRHGYRGPEKHLNNINDWETLRQNIPTINSLYPGIVTSVAERSITVLLTNNTPVILNWNQGLSQARPHINSDRIGPPPKSAQQIFTAGDVIRLAKNNAGWRLAQLPKAQAALAAIAPQDGKILALSGGYNYHWSKFNRATQAKRQPGSNLKPLLYAAAMEKKDYTAASIIDDAPLEFETEQGIWKPSNAGGKFYGPTRLRKALYFSRNLVTIRLLEDLGIRTFINYLSNFGIDASSLPYNLSLALGSNSMTPLQVANVFADIANGGFHIEPHLITQINKHNRSVYYNTSPVSCFTCVNHYAQQQRFEKRQLSLATDHDNLLTQIAKPSLQQASRVMDRRVNYILDSMLKDVIRQGTGKAALALNRADISGKTGTTNGPLDAWFSGYHPDIAVTTWLGFDRNEKLGKQEFGGSAALPIWITFMHEALKGVPEKYLIEPDDITTIPIDKRTGKALYTETNNSMMEIFRSENVNLPPPPRKKLLPQQQEEDFYFEPELNPNYVPIYDTQQQRYINETLNKASHREQQLENAIAEEQHTSNPKQKPIQNQAIETLNNTLKEIGEVETPDASTFSNELDSLIQEEAKEYPIPEYLD